jgi:hypothetical protein
MSKEGKNVEIPPPKGDAPGGKNTTIDGASKDSRVEQLSFELKQLKLQRRLTSTRRSSRILEVSN